MINRNAAHSKNLCPDLECLLTILRMIPRTIRITIMPIGENAISIHPLIISIIIFWIDFKGEKLAHYLVQSIADFQGFVLFEKAINGRIQSG